MQKNSLIRKVKFKIYDATIWATKGNQTMEFGQLIEHENIFLEKSCTKCGGETIPRLFFKKSKLGISLDQ